MPKEVYYRKMFLAGAVWNWGATISFALGYKVLFSLFGMEYPRYMVFFMMFLGLAFVFGIGYFWVSRDIRANHDIVRMGIAGKTVVFAALLWAWVSGEIPGIMVGPGIVDLVFALLYLEFLFAFKNAKVLATG